MLCSKRQINGEDFANFRGLLRKYELYILCTRYLNEMHAWFKTTVCGEYSSHQKNCPTQKLEITRYINSFIIKKNFILGWDSLIRKAKKDSPHAYVLGFL